VQFDRRELGVELVKDIDVMPIDPGDCLPPTVLAAERDLLLNGRRWSAGVPLRPRLAAMPGQVTDADRILLFGLSSYCSRSLRFDIAHTCVEASCSSEEGCGIVSAHKCTQQSPRDQA